MLFSEIFYDISDKFFPIRSKAPTPTEMMIVLLFSYIIILLLESFFLHQR